MQPHAAATPAAWDDNQKAIPNRATAPTARDDTLGSIAVFVGEVDGGRRRSEEKSKCGTFPPRLEIPQVQRDSHFSHRPCHYA